MTPHVPRCAEAVQHDDRWTMPADAYVDPGAVGFDLTRLHTGREGVDAILMSVAFIARSGLEANMAPTANRRGRERWLAWTCEFLSRFE
jgi:hypothetical protein